MPNIKPELQSKVRIFIGTRQGEALLILLIGGTFWSIFSYTVGAVAIYVSETLYPFTYVFFHTPLHGFLPKSVTETNFAADLIFGALFSLAVYYFEKNIFYRRFHLSLKAAFAAIAACTFVFLSGTVSFLFESIGTDILTLFLLEAEIKELPALFLYYYLASLPVFALCDTVRRRIFLLP